MSIVCFVLKFVGLNSSIFYKSSELICTKTLRFGHTYEHTNAHMLAVGKACTLLVYERQHLHSIPSLSKFSFWKKNRNRFICFPLWLVFVFVDMWYSYKSNAKLFCCILQVLSNIHKDMKISRLERAKQFKNVLDCFNFYQRTIVINMPGCMSELVPTLWDIICTATVAKICFQLTIVQP